MSSPTWYGDEPEAPPLGAGDWVRVVWRATLVVITMVLGLVAMLAVRLFERPLCGMRRPVSPGISRIVFRSCCAILGIAVKPSGPRLEGPGALVANHCSWFDIVALNARRDVYFVAKSEVSGWPVIGWLARLVGTVFITRDPRAAAEQKAVFEERLLHGHRLLFFPEGTSTDGMRILPFKSTLFAAFFSHELKHEMQLQAVTVIYHAPAGADPRFYGWWGGMSLGPHLLKLLGAKRQGSVELVYHPPVRVDDHPNRKTLAAHLEAQVRSAHPYGS
ncbi:lysophospholipid acyltransferase family protein [Salipiger thiooxidans]|uniref:lysophospholipid acyltransferase family protein n=1 Tax=Salipiger thiooxidans TaxID=282683 RepID=UPI001CD3E308|nr:lysophospholipid acyltransferase family protein [Salipiger thiooxidans]MCA0848471.1 1-acyl-sn-glycerol-3-phosphate acyltransferase [Salipiger thiooxidans]